MCKYFPTFGQIYNQEVFDHIEPPPVTDDGDLGDPPDPTLIHRSFSMRNHHNHHTGVKRRNNTSQTDIPPWVGWLELVIQMLGGKNCMSKVETKQVMDGCEMGGKNYGTNF